MNFLPFQKTKRENKIGAMPLFEQNKYTDVFEESKFE